MTLEEIKNNIQQHKIALASGLITAFSETMRFANGAINALGELSREEVIEAIKKEINEKLNELK